MANQVQDAILEAIDTLVNHRIENLQADKTITATIVSCTNALTGEYKVSYNGGFLYAYAQDGVSYTQNASVYVLIPQGDFTQKKTIISKTQAISNDQNISFVSSALSDYNLIGKNPLIDNSGVQPVGLNSYLKNDYALLYKYGETYPDIPFLTIDVQELENNLKEAEAIMIEGSFLTRLPKEHRLSKNGFYGLQFVLAFKDRDKVNENGENEIKYLSYTIDNNNMTGNPFLFTSWMEQYAIYPIDTENFLYIDSILAFSQDFVEQTDNINAELNGDDIFIKDLEIYGLKKISAVKGEYRLSLSMPNGSTFKSISSNSSLQVVGKVTQNISTLLSDSTMFYWFLEDNRISADSEYYQMYGGAGWKYLKDKGNNYTLTVYGNENRAYENKYLCVAVYKEEVILKEKFVIYNEAAKRDLSIESSLGIKFSFDRGTPTLTCLVDKKSENFEEGPNKHPDDWFYFIWSKEDEYGKTTIFNQTKDQLQAAYDQGVKDGIGYAALSALKNEIMAMEGVEFTPGKNKLTYPVKQIDKSAIFKCSVYLKDTEDGEQYNIGAATITLQNEEIASPTDYYITIENGDQVFQYSESGVAPNDERYTDPLEIKPLTCHFFDPAGLEVNNQTYEIKWLVPLTDTLIVAPSEGMTLNPATEKIEWCVSQNYPTAIKGNYDYQALNNQIKAIVTYQGQEYTQFTNFLFTKVGENGTNGTDIVAKISPLRKEELPENELLALELLDGVPTGWNNGQSPNDKVFNFELFQRNEKLNIDSTSISWSIAGGASTKSKYATSTNQDFKWSTQDSEKRMFRNQIVKGTARWESNDYYAFYPVPVIDYHESVSGAGKKYHIGIDSIKTLKTITYNSDGRNPLYNKNQGILINFSELTEKEISNKYIVWQAEGGQPEKIGTTYRDNPKNAAFTLIRGKDDANGENSLVPLMNDDGSWEFLNQIYILPNDIYDGAYCNNIIHCSIYSSNTAENPEVDIYIPIHMSLNTFGLKSLNAWDGNHVEINEDENYILAPQIGAGIKDSENKFTGVVMGKSQTYDAEDASVGLLGFSKGKQSIWLDAETGNAIFGLPENQASANNQYTEGRIELIPGGESKIGMWNIGSRAIYNITKPSEDGENFIGVEPSKPYSGDKYKVNGAQIAIGPENQGMILNANPAYLSVKSIPLTKDNDDIDWDGANTTIKPGDSLEVELDPSKSSVFSIYRHTTWDGAEDTGNWHRYPLVGINANGQFYTNAIEDGESSMGIGSIGAFNQSAADQRYVGAQFGWKGTNLFKFFVDVEEENVSDTTRTLFFSTGTNLNNEYPRNMSFHAKEIKMFSGTGINQTTKNKLLITSNSSFLGYEDNSYLELFTDSSQDKISSLSVKTNLKIKTEGQRDLSITSGKDLSFDSNKNLNVNIFENSKYQIGKDFSLISGGTSLHLENSLFSLNFGKNDDNSDELNMSSSDNRTYFKMKPYGQSEAFSYEGWLISSQSKGITLKAKSSEGIIVNALPPSGNSGQAVRMSLTPSDDGTGFFSIESGRGSLMSRGYKMVSGSNTLYNQISISPGFQTHWGYFDGGSKVPGRGSTAVYINGNIEGTNDLYLGKENSVQGDIKLYRNNNTGAADINPGKVDKWDKVVSNGWDSHTYSSVNSAITNAYNRGTQGVNAAATAQSMATSASSAAQKAYDRAETKLSVADFNHFKNNLSLILNQNFKDANQLASAIRSILWS